jgi:hypothetical protein
MRAGTAGVACPGVTTRSSGFAQTTTDFTGSGRGQITRLPSPRCSLPPWSAKRKGTA